MYNVLLGTVIIISIVILCMTTPTLLGLVVNNIMLKSVLGFLAGIVYGSLGVTLYFNLSK